MSIKPHLQSMTGTWLGTGKSLNRNEQGALQVRKVMFHPVPLPLSLFHSFIHSINVLSTCYGPGTVPSAGDKGKAVVLMEVMV